MDCCYLVDLLVEKRLVVEILTIEKIGPLNDARLLSYLRLGKWKAGLLINFRSPVLKEGILLRIMASDEIKTRPLQFLRNKP